MRFPAYLEAGDTNAPQRTRGLDSAWILDEVLRPHSAAEPATDNRRRICTARRAVASSTGVAVRPRAETGPRSVAITNQRGRETLRSQPAQVDDEAGRPTAQPCRPSTSRLCIDKSRGPLVRTRDRSTSRPDRASSERVDGGGCWRRAWATGPGRPTTAVADDQPP